MARYWPSSFFLRFSVHKVAKKERGQYPAILTEQAWSIKDFLYGLKITPKNFAFAGTKREIPSGQDRLILPTRVASHIIMCLYTFICLCLPRENA